MNHFCVDHPSTSKRAGTRTAPRSAKRRSAAVSTTPAQAPSKQPSRPTSKRSTAKSSGKRRQVHATVAADPSGVDHPVAHAAHSKASNKQSRPDPAPADQEEKKGDDSYSQPSDTPPVAENTTDKDDATHSEARPATGKPPTSVSEEDDFAQSMFPSQRTAQSARGSTCKRTLRGGSGPNPLGLSRLPVQAQAPPKDPLQADPTHSVGASQAQNPTIMTGNARTRGGTASRSARGSGYVMKRTTTTTRPSYEVSPDYPDTDPPTVSYDQSELIKPPTGTAPEKTADATEAVETPDAQDSTTNPASIAEEAVEIPDAQILPTNPSHSDGPSPTAPIRPPATTGPSNRHNFSSQQAVVAPLPAAAGPSISRPPANIANIFGEQALAALVEQVAQQATLRITAALDKKLGNIEELLRERPDDQQEPTMAEDRQALQRQNREPKK